MNFEFKLHEVKIKNELFGKEEEIKPSVYELSCGLANIKINLEVRHKEIINALEKNYEEQMKQIDNLSVLIRRYNKK